MFFSFWLPALVNSLFFVTTGALVGWILRGHILLAALVASLLSLFIPLCYEYAVGRLRLPISVHDFLSGLIMVSPLLILFCWLPAVAGALLSGFGLRYMQR